MNEQPQPPHDALLALQKAADTFHDFALALRLFGKEELAEAAGIAERYCRQAAHDERQKRLGGPSASSTWAIKRPNAPVATVELHSGDNPTVEIPYGFGLKLLIKDEARGYEDTFARLDEYPDHAHGPMAEDGMAHA